MGNYTLPEFIFMNNCLGFVNVADNPSCYVHLTEACNGDARIADILYVSMLGWGGYHIKELLWLVSTIQRKEDIGCDVAAISF